LGNYQYIKTYTDLIEAIKLYKLEEDLRNKLSINNEEKINKIKI
jgi:hypothetical protein